MSQVNFSEYVINVPEKWRHAFRLKANVQDPMEEREKSVWDAIMTELLTGNSK